jgi:Putative zinc-finger
MNHDHHNEDLSAHGELSLLIPWYVNGTIGELDRHRFESHLQNCDLCRDDLRFERSVYQNMAVEASIEYMPAGSLKRLQARLDDLDDEIALSDSSSVAAPARRWPAWRGLIAASIAAVAVAVGVMAVDRWTQFHSAGTAPDYYTVTTPEQRAPDEVIRAVFSPAITLVELQALLNEAQMRIISGPTEAGVYSLAATSARPVGLSLALLRQHTAVRFAEITQTTKSSAVP